VTLTGSVAGGASAGTWSGGTGTFNPNASTLNATYTPSAAEITAGTVTLTLTTNDPAGPCFAVSDQVQITIKPGASANAGADLAVCASNPTVTLSGSVGGGASNGHWGGGSGTYSPDSTALNAAYTPSAAEIAAGTVTLTLTTNDPSGPCPAVSDQVVITINPLPPCGITGPSEIAERDTATLCGPAGNFRYRWSTGETTRCIKTSQGGEFTLTLTDATTQCVSACSTTLRVVPCACQVSYPDSTNPPRSLVVFNESEVLRAAEPGPTNCASAGAAIKLWYNDEHALTLGVRRVIVKTSTGTTTTDYPISPGPSTPGCVLNPQVGTTVASGDQSGNDVAGGGGRPLRPALFITDLTMNGATSRAGDWQQGGVGISPHKVCGTWKAAVKALDKTRVPELVTVTPDGDPTRNDWNLGGGDAPPDGLVNQGYGAECVWFVDQLDLIAGHTYRMYFMVHDGDQNKSGGDVGHACTTVHIPETVTGVPPAPKPQMPRQFELAQNFPNPFRSRTTIRYALPERSTIQLGIYDLSGREIARLVDGTVEPGEYAIVWEPVDRSGRAVPPGLYMYRMHALSTAGQYRQFKKMILVR
jgi:hypothetical protein